MNHKQALIIFWSSVAVMLITGISVSYLSVNKITSLPDIYVYLLMVGSLFVFPVIIFLPLIGSGYFKNKVIKL